MRGALGSKRTFSVAWNTFPTVLSSQVGRSSFGGADWAFFLGATGEVGAGSGTFFAFCEYTSPDDGVGFAWGLGSGVVGVEGPGEPDALAAEGTFCSLASLLRRICHRLMSQIRISQIVSIEIPYLRLPGV